MLPRTYAPAIPQYRLRMQLAMKMKMEKLRPIVQAYAISIAMWCGLSVLTGWNYRIFDRALNINSTVFDMLFLAESRGFAFAILTPPIFYLARRYIGIWTGSAPLRDALCAWGRAFHAAGRLYSLGHSSTVEYGAAEICRLVSRRDLSQLFSRPLPTKSRSTSQSWSPLMPISISKRLAHRIWTNMNSRGLLPPANYRRSRCNFIRTFSLILCTASRR